LAGELLRRLDGRVRAHEDPVRRPPVPERDGLHLGIGVGARGDDGGNVRDPDVALAGGNALDGVGRALAADDLHVEPFLAIPALLDRGVVGHVLTGRHEVEDEGVRLQRRLAVGEGQRGSTPPSASSATQAQIVGRLRASFQRARTLIGYCSPIARRSSVVTRVASAMMNAISLLVVMKRAPFLMYST